MRVATQYAPARCTPDAAAQLQPIPYACGAQRALLPVAVGAMNINALMNINDVRESATIFPRPCKLIFDLLTLKVVSESRVTWATCVPILVCLCLFVLDLGPMYATDRLTDVRQTDRQTDVRQHHRLIPPPSGRGIITNANVVKRRKGDGAALGRASRTDRRTRQVIRTTRRVYMRVCTASALRIRTGDVALPNYCIAAESIGISVTSAGARC